MNESLSQCARLIRYVLVVVTYSLPRKLTSLTFAQKVHFYLSLGKKNIEFRLSEGKPYYALIDYVDIHFGRLCLNCSNKTVTLKGGRVSEMSPNAT